MSEEEKKAIEYWKTHMEILHWNTQLASEHYINVLLNLIEKQSKEIEYLKSQIPTDKIFYYSYKDFISKDKIKAKIEECREILYSFEKELELKANKDKFIHKEGMSCLLGQISILQSLLEED